MKKLALFILVILACCGCGPRPADMGFPPYLTSYNSGWLHGEEGFTKVREMSDIDMSPYPHLKVKDGFSLKRAVTDYIGGDQISCVVALHNDSNLGFVVEPLDGIQGEYLFAPLKDPDEILEYTEFMTHETPESDYNREHKYIYSQTEYDNALQQLKKYTVLRDPPTTFTRVTEQKDGSYLVELVYSCSLYQQRIEYVACIVNKKGGIILKDYFTFVQGPFGAVL
jgi:hypothetical protein